MADTLKQIYAGVISMSDVANTGGIQLASTDANTQYVIKDVSVSGAFTSTATPTLNINGFSVAGLNTNASGSEIVDVSSTIEYKAFASAPALIKKTVSLIDNLRMTTKVETYANGSTISASTDSQTTSSISTVTGNSNLLINSSGSLFYSNIDGNSQVQLYKNVDNVETQIFAGSYCWIVCDGVSKYYYTKANNSYLWTYNIETGAETSRYTGGNILSNTSYPSAWWMNNGKILINYSGNGQTSSFWILDPTSGGPSSVSIQDVSVSGTTYRISGFYDSVTGAYTFYKRFNTTLYKNYSVGGVNSFTQYTIPSDSYATSGYTTCDATKYSWALHGVSGGTKLFTLDTSTGVSTTSDFLSSRTMNGLIQIKNETAVASSVTKNISVRITGIKSTI